MKQPSTKQIITDINKKIEGLTHDIKTLEGFASSLLAMRMEMKDLQSSIRDFKTKSGCKFHATHCEPNKCGFTDLLVDARRE